MYKCKITVLKRVANPKIVDEYMGDEPKAGNVIPCQNFQDGQEFVLDSWAAPPEGFCTWAWADIHKYILLVMSGGDFTPWVKQKGTAIACCTDGYRPVVFKLERIE